MDMKTIATYVYTDSDIAQKEQHLLSNNWILAGLSSQLPENSTVMVIRILHTSILLSRDELGVVHAMENSCVHRGTQILSDKQAKKWKGISASKLHCRYHGWEYNMHGILQHVPKREKIVCATPALRKFMVREQYGCIWVCLSAPSIPVEELLGEFESKIAHYNFAEMEAIEAKDFHFSVNWKIALENALDFYHVGTVHPKTVGAHSPVAPTFEDMRWVSLQTLHIAPYSWRRKLDEHCARYRAYSDHELSSLHKYYVYPNLVINVLPYHITIMQFFPVDKDSCIMRYRFCKRKGAGIIENARVYASWLASRVILYEDVRLYPSIQKGIENSSLPVQNLHEEERAVGHFHACLLRGMQQ